MSVLVSYVRVSTIKQDFDRQAPATEGTTITFMDKFTGKTMQGRNGLLAAMNYVQKGDTLVVMEMWRLGRSVPDVRKVVQELIDKGVNVHFKSEGLYMSADTESPMAKAMNTMILTVMAACGEFDRAYKEITIKQGVEVAKADGKKFGAANPKHRRTFTKNKALGLHRPSPTQYTVNPNTQSTIDEIKKVVKLVNVSTFQELTDKLNRASIFTATGKEWTRQSLCKFCNRYKISLK